MQRIGYLFIVLIFVTSCIGGLGFAINDKVIGNYYLVAADINEQLSLSYHGPDDGDIYGTVIDRTVFAVGNNDKYIIAKQHPSDTKSITNYFILPIKNGMNWKSKNGLIGPLTKEQFEVKRKQLGIEGLEFTKIYKDLE